VGEILQFSYLRCLLIDYFVVSSVFHVVWTIVVYMVLVLCIMTSFVIVFGIVAMCDM
jgi:hypothetical protein